MVKASRETVALRLVQKTVLQKKAGQIDQVVALPDGDWAIRDANFFNPGTQALETYGRDGTFLRRIGEFGRGPGKYFRLRGLDAAPDSTLWTADVTRINIFKTNGEFVRTILIQNPGYQLNDLALDSSRGFLYVAGCLPLKTYLDNGCTLIHQYSLEDNRYVRSFLATDVEALENNWLPLEWYAIDVDSKGAVYLVDKPVQKLFRVDPASGTTAGFPIHSLRMDRVPYLFPVNTRSHEVAYEEGFLLDRVIAVGDQVFISVRKPHSRGYLLQVFDSAGEQIASDIEAPGRLVGRAPNGSLLFVPQGEFAILEYQFSQRKAR